MQMAIFETYLYCIQTNPEYASPLQPAAVETERMLNFIDQLGVVVGMRMRETCEAALNVYAPHSRATHRLSW